MINRDELIENKKINYEDMTKEEVINYTRLIEVTNNTLHEIILVKDKVITEMANLLFDGYIHNYSSVDELIAGVYKKVEEEND